MIIKTSVVENIHLASRRGRFFASIVFWRVVAAGELPARKIAEREMNMDAENIMGAVNTERAIIKAESKAKNTSIALVGIEIWKNVLSQNGIK